jgi:xylulokinase
MKVMSDEYIASFDIGTSKCKLSLIDKRGSLFSTCSVEYTFSSPKPNWAEQKPEEYWKAVCQVTKMILQQTGIKKENIIAMVFATIWKGIIPLDQSDQVLYNNIIWLDGRANKQAVWLNQRMNIEYFSRKDYWPKLLWFKEENPDLYRKTASILDVNAYLKFKATGSKSTDISNHFIRSHDPVQQESYDRFLDTAEINKDLFPPLTQSTDCVGELNQTAADELGLCKGTRVYAGCSDIAAIAIGSGNAIVDSQHIYFGTSGWFGIVKSSTKTFSSNCGRVAPLHRDADIVIAGTNAACGSLEWAIDQFFLSEKQAMGKSIYEFIQEQLNHVPAGSDGLLASNWLFGEMPPLNPKARAVFINLKQSHDRFYLIKAMLEAVCYMLRWKRELLLEQLGKDPGIIRAVGGGSLNDHWMQILSDILGIPVAVPDYPQYAGTLGAGYCALLGLGLCSGFDEIGNRIMVKKIFLPRSHNLPIYKLMFESFLAIEPALQDIFNHLNTHEAE